MKNTTPYWLTLAAVLLPGCVEQALAQPAGAPTVEAAKQALNRKWQKLKPDYVAERNVLFQDVLAGKADAGSYPFRVTVLIRDYDAGYAANRNYGKTCVSRIEQGVYTLEAVGDRWRQAPTYAGRATGRI